MVDFLTISWYIGLVGTILGIPTTIIFIKTLIQAKIDTHTKKSLSWMLVTSICVISYTTMIIIFGIIKLEPSNMLWIIFPLVYIVVALSWFKGTHKLLEIVGGSDIKDE